MADSKITQLTELTTPAGGDLVEIVDDPTGTPISKKVSVTNLLNQVQRFYTLTVAGALTATAGTTRIPNRTGKALTISAVYLDVDTPPSGTAIIVDVNENGTTIFSTQSNRPQIAAGANAGSALTINDASWANGNYLTADVDQVGSGTAGSNLTVTVVAS